MKKILGVMMSVQVILFSIMGMQIYRNVNYVNLIYRDNTAILIRANDSVDNLLDYMQTVDNNIIISKYSFIDSNNLVIYTNDSTLGGKIKIDCEHYLSDNESFIANYTSGDINQICEFYTFIPNLRVTIYSLEKLRNSGIDGLYYVNDDYSLDVVLQINNGIGYAELYSDYTSDLTDYIEESYELIASACLTTILMIIFIIHYIIGRNKKVAILKMQGCNVFETYKSILKESVGMQITIFICTFAFLSCCSILLYGSRSIFTMVKVFFVSFMAINMLLVCVEFIALYIAYKLGKVIPIIKGRRPFKVIMILHFLLKSILLSTLLVGCISLFNQIQYLNIQQKNLESWKKAENIYATKLKYVGESRLSEKKLHTFYDLLESLGAFLIDTSNYELVDGENHLYDCNAPGEESLYDPYGQSIIVNENYIKINPVTINDNKEEVFKLLAHSDTVRNILVPQSLSIYETEIKERFLENFYFQKVEVENIYNEDANEPLNDLQISELDINLIYIDDNQKFFAYSNVEEDNHCYIDSPIIIVETGNIDESYYKSYLSRCMYFKNTTMDAFDYLLPIIDKADVKSEIQSVVSIYDNYGKVIYNLTIKKNCLLTALIILTALFLATGYLIVASYFAEKKYPIYIKRLFGYSVIQRIYRLLVTVLLLDVVVINIVCTIQSNMMIWKIGLLVLIIDIIAISLEIRALDKKSFNTVIKGEH